MANGKRIENFNSLTYTIKTKSVLRSNTSVNPRMCKIVASVELPPSVRVRGVPPMPPIEFINISNLTNKCNYGTICLLKAIEQIATTFPTDGVMYGNGHKDDD